MFRDCLIIIQKLPKELCTYYLYGANKSGQILDQSYRRVTVKLLNTILKDCTILSVQEYLNNDNEHQVAVWFEGVPNFCEGE